jgi:hypothetical protein
VGGAVGAYAGAAVVSDPRRSGRKIVAAVLFLASIFWVYMPWFNQLNVTNPNIGIAAAFAVIGSLVAIISVSKFATRYPFTVFRYGDYLMAAFAGLAAKVTWGALLVGWVGAIISTLARSGAAMGLFATLMVAGIIGVGVSAVRVENKVVAIAIHVRDQVAQVFGAHPDTVEAGNTGSLRKPEYTCFFPGFVGAEQLPAIEQTIGQQLPGFEVVKLTTEGVSLVQR